MDQWVSAIIYMKVNIKDKDKMIIRALRVLGYKLDSKVLELVLNVADFVTKKGGETSLMDLVQIEHEVESLYSETPSPMKDAPARVLKFNNPVFNKGESVTVRRGLKWADCLTQRVILEDLREVMISSIKIVPSFDYIREIDLANEHDPKCRTKEGLFQVLQETYEGVTKEEPFTLIYFYVDEYYPK